MIRLLIVDRLPSMCDAMQAILSEEFDIRVVGTAMCLEEAMPQLDLCNMILVSAAIQGCSAVQFIRAAKSYRPGIKVVVMDVGEGQGLQATLVGAGAADCVFESESIDEMLSKLRTIHSGIKAIGRKSGTPLAARLVELARMVSEDQEIVPGWRDLTPRERQVMDLLCRGLTSREVAASLAIDLRTVKRHILHIRRKLNIPSRYHLASQPFLGQARS